MHAATNPFGNGNTAGRANRLYHPPPTRPPPPARLQVRHSERNVVELVNKLKQLGLLGDELLYTTNGKEYVTRERVQAEVRAAVRAAGGRIPLVRWRRDGGVAAAPPWVHVHACFFQWVRAIS